MDALNKIQLDALETLAGTVAGSPAAVTQDIKKECLYVEYPLLREKHEINCSLNSAAASVIDFARHEILRGRC